MLREQVFGNFSLNLYNLCPNSCMRCVWTALDGRHFFFILLLLLADWILFCLFIIYYIECVFGTKRSGYKMDASKTSAIYMCSVCWKLFLYKKLYMKYSLKSFFVCAVSIRVLSYDDDESEKLIMTFSSIGFICFLLDSCEIDIGFSFVGPSKCD